MILRIISAWVLLLAFVSGCNSPDAIQKVERRIDRQSGGDVTGDANLTLQFDDVAFTAHHVGLTSLTFKLKFAGATREGAVVFNGTQGSLKASSLPSGKAGEVVVEFFESSALKMVGRLAGVTLSKGENQLTLSNFSADGIDLNAGWDGKSFQGSKDWKVEGL